MLFCHCGFIIVLWLFMYNDILYTVKTDVTKFRGLNLFQRVITSIYSEP